MLLKSIVPSVPHFGLRGISFTSEVRYTPLVAWDGNDPQESFLFNPTFEVIGLFRPKIVLELLGAGGYDFVGVISGRVVV